MKVIEINSPKYGVHQLEVDDEDFDTINKYKWYLTKGGNTFYPSAYIYKKSKTVTSIRAYRLILGDQPGLIDHKDGNGLNNQRSNIRYCTSNQNKQNSRLSRNNTSGYKGVVYQKIHGKYNARITVNGKRKHLGQFEDPRLAAEAYNTAAQYFFGEFANVNNLTQHTSHENEKHTHTTKNHAHPS